MNKSSENQVLSGISTTEKVPLEMCINGADAYLDMSYWTHALSSRQVNHTQEEVEMMIVSEARRQGDLLQFVNARHTNREGDRKHVLVRTRVFIKVFRKKNIHPKLKSNKNAF